MGSRLNILVVDDEPNIRFLVQLSLESQFNVTLCEDGLSGLALATQKPFDVILLDLTLPDENGSEIYEKYTQQVSLEKQAVVIFFTAETSLKMDVKKFESCGFIQKPFDPEELADLVLAFYKEKKLGEKCPA